MSLSLLCILYTLLLLKTGLSVIVKNLCKLAAIIAVNYWLVGYQKKDRNQNSDPQQPNYEYYVWTFIYQIFIIRIVARTLWSGTKYPLSNFLSPQFDGGTIHPETIHPETPRQCNP